MTLNGSITEEEMKKNINQLKNNKEVGIDCIMHEYIKNTKDLYCPLYVKLFNKILDADVMPEKRFL